MSVSTILCRPDQLSLTWQDLKDRLVQAGRLRFVKFTSLGEGHIVINYVGGHDATNLDYMTVFEVVDGYLRRMGFTPFDEGYDCRLYKQ